MEEREPIAEPEKKKRSRRNAAAENPPPTPDVDDCLAYDPDPPAHASDGGRVPPLSTEGDGHIVEDLRPLATPIEGLRHDPKNARRHNARNLEAIAASLSKYGQRKPVIALRDGTIIAGNGTMDAALSLGWPTLAVVRVDDDDRTAAAFAIADNRSAELAEWDQEQLADTLKWLLDGSDDAFAGLGEASFTQDEINELLAAAAAGAGDGGTDDLYTKKIQAPIYEIRGECPEASELVNLSKTRRLLAEIEDAPDLPDDVRNFLAYAAQRHAVFDYQKIAEFYAHAPKETQALMEKSALVIIDFDKAIENGFVSVSESIAERYKEDTNDDDAAE